MQIEHPGCVPYASLAESRRVTCDSHIWPESISREFWFRRTTAKGWP